MKNVFYKQNKNPKTKKGFFFIYLEDTNKEVEETVTRKKIAKVHTLKRRHFEPCTNIF